MHRNSRSVGEAELGRVSQRARVNVSGGTDASAVVDDRWFRVRVVGGGGKSIASTSSVASAVLIAGRWRRPGRILSWKRLETLQTSRVPIVRLIHWQAKQRNIHQVNTLEKRLAVKFAQWIRIFHSCNLWLNIWIFISHTHTHTHTQRGRERERMMMTEYRPRNWIGNSMILKPWNNS